MTSKSQQRAGLRSGETVVALHDFHHALQGLAFRDVEPLDRRAVLGPTGIRRQTAPGGGPAIRHTDGSTTYGREYPRLQDVVVVGKVPGWCLRQSGVSRAAVTLPEWECRRRPWLESGDMLGLITMLNLGLLRRAGQVRASDVQPLSCAGC